MRTSEWIAAIALSLALGASPATARVVLVGVDGASWNRLDAMMAAGELPSVAALIARGASAELATVEPVNSPVVWSSIATGHRPKSHGVGDFFATSLSLKVPTTFERMARSGLRVGLYDYLVTWPPKTFPTGFVIPGWLRRDAATTPPDVWDRIALEPYAISYDGAYSNADYLARAKLDVQRKAERWNALATAFDLDVGAVTFYAVDMTCHRFWEAGFPQDFPDATGDKPLAERVAIAEAYRGVDRSIGAIASALGPEDTLIVVSDHGFRADPDGGRDVWVTHLDDALAAAGFDEQRDGFTVVGTFGAVTLRVHPGETAERDALTDRLLELLRSYQGADGTPLYAAVESVDGEGRHGPPRSWAVRLRQWVVAQAASWMFDVELEPTVHAVVFALPDVDEMLARWPDGRVRVGGHEFALSDVVTRQRFDGTHDPTAVFVAAGGPIARRTERGRLSVLDISALLFYAAGQPIPDDLEGALPVELLRSDYREEHPPRYVPGADVPGIASASPDAADDPALIEKLKALGYLE